MEKLFIICAGPFSQHFTAIKVTICTCDFKVLAFRETKKLINKLKDATGVKASVAIKKKSFEGGWTIGTFLPENPATMEKACSNVLLLDPAWSPGGGGAGPAGGTSTQPSPWQQPAPVSS